MKLNFAWRNQNGLNRQQPPSEYLMLVRMMNRSNKLENVVLRFTKLRCNEDCLQVAGHRDVVVALLLVQDHLADDALV